MKALIPTLLIALMLLPARALCVELTLPDPLSEEISRGRLETWKENIVETGIGQDSIRAVDSPQFIGVEDAALVIDDNEIVFVADLAENDVRIYPQKILVWHQVVNDKGPQGEPIAVTYCPLTGSLNGYKTRLGRYALRFGVMGSLVNNNSILYDRSTLSLWPQMLGVAIDGPLTSKKITRFPMIWTTWERASTQYPNARVLSPDTGHRLFYVRDPYGNYQNTTSYYHDDMIVYPLTHWDKRLPPKERIYGVLSPDGQPYAVLSSAVAEKGVLPFWMDMTPVAAIYDRELDTVRIFRAEAARQTITLEYVGGEVRDKESKSVWTPSGVCTSGSFYGERLEQITGYDAFWFAFAAFYPDVRIIPPLPGDSGQW